MLPNYYCFTKVTTEKEMFWFSVESDHSTLFLLKFFRKMRKVEKLVKKGLISVYGHIPDVMFCRLALKIDIEEKTYEDYQYLKKNGIKEVRI